MGRLWPILEDLVAFRVCPGSSWDRLGEVCVAPGHSLGGVLDRFGGVLMAPGRCLDGLGGAARCQGGFFRGLLNFTQFYPPSPKGNLSTFLIE